MLKTIFHTITFSLLTVLTQAQFTLHLDKQYYVVGEVAWYKLYLPQEQDATVRVVLSDSNANRLDDFYLKSEGKSFIEGYFKIPFNYKSGLYRLSFFTTDEDQNLIIDPVIPIYNDLSSHKGGISTTEKQYNQNTLVDGQLKIEIQLNQNDFQRRSSVEATVSITDSSGNPVSATVSVAVSDEKLAAGAQVLNSTTNIPTIGNTLEVSGVLKNDEGKPIRAGILGMYSRDENRMYYSKANEMGEFSFTLPDYYTQKPVQFIGYQFEHKSIKVDLDDLPIAPINDEIVYTEEIIEYLNLSQQRKKIYQINTSIETNLDIETYQPDAQILKPEFSYKIKDYESFDFMHNFFGELITPLKFSLQKDSTFKAILTNPSGRKGSFTVLSGPPLFIIDGKLTRNADYVAKLDMDYIDKVSLFYKTDALRRQFNAIGSSGVVMITTNLRNVELPEEDEEDFFILKGIQPKATFPVFEPAEVPKLQPFFRPQLYWNPSIETDKNGKASFQFYQSDDRSRFKIQVVAKSKEGEIGIAETFYDVKL